MAKSRFDNLDEEKREVLIEEAGREFAEAGFEGASLNQIIERADFSKGSLYYYFENKEDLYETVACRGAERLAEEFGFSEEQLTAETFWEELERLTIQSLEFVQRHDWYVELFRSLYRMRDRHPDEGPAADLFDDGQDWVKYLIAQGQQLGVVRQDLPLEFLVEAAMGVVEACDRWFLRYIDDVDEDEMMEQSRKQFDMIRGMLEPPETSDRNEVSQRTSGSKESV
jgi:AcrR family transcriptional regulator